MRKTFLNARPVSMADAVSPLDAAFAALGAYDWGHDAAAVRPIEDAIASSVGNAQARAELEARLAAVAASNAPQAGKLLACKQLSRIGGAACVSALAALVTDETLGHVARYALERIPAAEAGAALRAALEKASPKLKVGIINSLGERRDAASVAALCALTRDGAKEVAAAAVAALGDIGGAEAAKELEKLAAAAPKELALVIADARVGCAERFLAEGKRGDATAIYRALQASPQAAHVKEAARRGLERSEAAK
jgi:hypothetical protein